MSLLSTSANNNNFYPLLTTDKNLYSTTTHQVNTNTNHKVSTTEKTWHNTDNHYYKTYCSCGTIITNTTHSLNFTSAGPQKIFSCSKCGYSKTFSQ